MTLMSSVGAGVSVPPLTAQEKVVVDEIRQLLSALEQAGVQHFCAGGLRYLSDDILSQSVAERSRALMAARDRYQQDVLRLKSERFASELCA